MFYNTADGWREAEQPFAQTTENTMSFARGDLDNNGSIELLATDMKPYTTGAAVDAAWAPLRAETIGLGARDGVQTEENVLQVRSGEASAPFINRAVEAGVSATGWTWSAQFGDLDSDGHLDLYVVNGMIAEEIFGHLPGAELVEENQALRNVGGGRFVPAPEWGLAATESGRGMAMADLDRDGDLDIVVNNLQTATMLFENRICAGSALEVDLRWEGSPNRRAVGATTPVEDLAADQLVTVTRLR